VVKSERPSPFGVISAGVASAVSIERDVAPATKPVAGRTVGPASIAYT
jgi:hypothetical protein